MLQFSFEEFTEEARVFMELASPIIAATSHVHVNQALTELESYRRSADRHPRIFKVASIESDSVNVSVAGGTAMERMYAAISIAWPIEKVAAAPHDRFYLVNEAKTFVDIIRWQRPKVLRSYTARVASSRYVPFPLNCMVTSTFETVEMSDDEGHLRPQELMDVPFIPTIAISPFAAAEFALAELWPHAWLRLTSSGPAAQRWRLIQRRRIDRFLTWMATQARVSPISPLMAIRTSRPPSTIFCVDMAYSPASLL